VQEFVEQAWRGRPAEGLHGCAALESTVDLARDADCVEAIVDLTKAGYNELGCPPYLPLAPVIAPFPGTPTGRPTLVDDAFPALSVGNMPRLVHVNEHGHRANRLCAQLQLLENGATGVPAFTSDRATIDRKHIKRNETEGVP
jgi:hypothetical protein